MVRSGWGVIDSDEAVVGLMARSIVRSDLPTFYWGQNYGGSAEAFLVAAAGGVFGWSTFAIRIVALTLSAAAAVLVWRIGRRTVGNMQGAAAALFFWLWPVPSLFASIKLGGFYWATIVAGLAFVLCALRLAAQPNRRDAVVAGFAAGVGWWSSPYVVVYVIPAVVWLLARHRQALRPLVVLGLPGAVLGALPWIAFNVRHGFVSLRAPELHLGGSGTYGDHLQTFATRGLPTALGARLPWSEQWIPGGKVLYALGVMALTAVVVAKRPPLVAVALLVFPLVHAASPLAFHVGSGRYLVYYAPFLALAVAAVAPHRTALSVLAVGMCALSVYSLDRTQGLNTPYSGERRMPEDVAPLIADLETRDLRHVYSDYWIGYRLAFESDERIIAAGGRNEELTRRVEAAPRVAYVYLDDTRFVHSLRHELTRINQPWQEHAVAGFRVIVPDRPVTPEEIWGS